MKLLIVCVSLAATSALNLQPVTSEGWLDVSLNQGKHCPGGTRVWRNVGNGDVNPLSQLECKVRGWAMPNCPWLDMQKIDDWECYCMTTCTTLLTDEEPREWYIYVRPGTDNPHAVGDPEMRNVMGEKFSIRKGGMHNFLSIPRGAQADKALLHVDAKVLGEKPKACSVFFIKRIYIGGTWLGDVPALTFAVAEEMEDQRAAGFRIGNSTFVTADDFASRIPSSLVKVEMKSGGIRMPDAVNSHITTMTAKIRLPSQVQLAVSWVSERISDSHVAQSLWLTTSGMASLNMPVGGLLGTSDHTAASEPDEACQQSA